MSKKNSELPDERNCVFRYFFLSAEEPVIPPCTVPGCELRPVSTPESSTMGPVLLCRFLQEKYPDEARALKEKLKIR